MKDLGCDHDLFLGWILRKTMESINKDIHCPGQDTKQAPPEYQSDVLPLHPII
jgi:hypothetical protein